MYNYYNDYYNEDYQSISEAIEDLENEDNCKPTIIDIVTTQDVDTGEYSEQKIYNCTNCANVDCPYFYEMTED